MSLAGAFSSPCICLAGLASGGGTSFNSATMNVIDLDSYNMWEDRELVLCRPSWFHVMNISSMLLQMKEFIFLGLARINSSPCLVCYTAALLPALATLELFSNFIFNWQQLAVFLDLITSSWMPLSITLCCCSVLWTQPALPNCWNYTNMPHIWLQFPCRYSVMSAFNFHSL